MPRNEKPGWYHCNRYSADSACEYCGSIIRHEPWCIRQDSANPKTEQLLLDGTHLTQADHLILHALGVTWTATGTATGARPSFA